MHRLAVDKRTRLMADKEEAAPQGTAGKQAMVRSRRSMCSPNM